MIEDLGIGESIPTISYVICRLRAWHLESVHSEKFASNSPYNEHLSRSKDVHDYNRVFFIITLHAGTRPAAMGKQKHSEHIC